MPGERRGPVPPKFRPAPVTTKQVPIGPSLSHSHSFIGGRPGDGIAVSIIHSRRIPLPPLPMISAAIAGMQQLMGQGLPAAHFRSLRHPPGQGGALLHRQPITGQVLRAQRQRRVAARVLMTTWGSTFCETGIPNATAWAVTSRRRASQSFKSHLSPLPGSAHLSPSNRPTAPFSPPTVFPAAPAPPAAPPMPHSHWPVPLFPS